MRERLIELIKASLFRHIDKSCCLAENIADDLLANGVIVLPAKIGQTVYVPWRWDGTQAVASVVVEEITFYDSKMNYMFCIDMESDDECFNQSFGGWQPADSIGKTVFLTREEAEEALEKMKGGAER